MKIIFLIYIHALWIYAVLGFPVFFINPVIYVMFLIYAGIFSLLALLVFSLAFLFIFVIKPKPVVATITLAVAAVPSVGVAYNALNHSIGSTTSIWAVDGFTYFPIIAIIAVWMGIAIAGRHVNEYFETLRFQKQLKHSLNTSNQTI